MHRSLMMALAVAAPAIPFETTPAAATSCASLGVGTRIVSGTAGIQPTALDPAKTYCLDSRTNVIIVPGTIAPSGALDVYTRRTFDPAFVQPYNHLNSVLLSGTSIASAPNPGTPFLRIRPMPATGTLGAMRVNLVNVEIGENRSIELTKASGLSQIQDVFIVSTQPRTYQTFSISNPNNVSIGSYNLNGQTFLRPTQLTLRQSSITNAGLLGVEKGSTLKLDSTTIETGIVGLYGTLAGNGTVRGPAGVGSNVNFRTGTGAVFSPGLSIGTLNIGGNLSLQGATSLISEIDPNAAQNADLLSVSGTVTGADKLTVTLEKDNGYTATGAGEVADFTGSTYTVLTAASIDSNSIALVEGGSLNAHLSARLIGQPSNTGQIVVGFTDNSAVPGHVPSKLPASTPWSTLVSAIAATHNNTVVNGSSGGGTAPGATGTSNGGQQQLSNGQTVSTAWLGLTNAQVSQLDQVHAEPYSSNLTVGLEQLEHVASSVMARMTSQDHDHDNGKGHALWMDASYSRGHVQGRDSLGSFGYSLSNLLVGTDLIERERFSAGVFGGYGYTSMHEHDKVTQDFSGQSAIAGAYATAQIERFTFATVVGYAHGWHKSTRINRDVGLFSGGVASSSYTSDNMLASAHLGYQTLIGEGMQLEPFVAAAYSRIWQNSLTETGGGDFNYSIAAANAEALTGGLGVKFTQDLPNTAQERKLRLTGVLRYDHDFEAARTKAHQITATSHLFGTFTQTGQNRGAHTVTGSLGLSGALSRTVSVRAGVTGSLSQHGHEFGARGHLRVAF
ncbi:Uncharacterized protein HPDFL43_06952 [Hoeflea phototrophica DFL-43]|uniref:Autotransporter domain-containing protein n=1 Tax=Hoeflea phototrophica (strain DSM 17068 / NCIMB 14078 / DFL-43) TaxID=411684 RepID=A9DCT0_HOEPD|nr:autotransporter outer membrane beta-barrel domain-containing protein [Hoeflea phototrophica]EDQ32199.2 Uncharacterized protein HPDFL43_06952 [Hoeflea phototrophica DFL-43]